MSVQRGGVITCLIGIHAAHPNMVFIISIHDVTSLTTKFSHGTQDNEACDLPVPKTIYGTQDRQLAGCNEGMELRCRPLIELQVSLSSWIWHVELEYPNRHFNHYSKSSPALLSNCCPGVTLATHSFGLDPLRDIGCLKYQVQGWFFAGSTVTVVGKDMTTRRRQFRNFSQGFRSFDDK